MRLPCATAPVEQAAEAVVINTMLAELNNHLGMDQATGMTIDRTIINNRGVDHYVLVRASHSQRLERLCNKDQIFKTVLPFPVLNKFTVEEASRGLKRLTKDLPAGQLGNLVVIFQILDNAAYMGELEDGSTVPAKRDHAAKYHVPGKLVLAPKNTVRSLMSNAKPMLEAAGSMRKVLLVPMPRYLTGKCCQDPTHITNFGETGYAASIKAQLEGLRKSIKTYLFQAGIRGVIVANPGSIWTDTTKNYWGEDPVHPSEEAYHALWRELQTKANLTVNHDPGSKRRRDDQGRDAPKRARDEGTNGSYATGRDRGHWHDSGSRQHPSNAWHDLNGRQHDTASRGYWRGQRGSHPGNWYRPRGRRGRGSSW